MADPPSSLVDLADQLAMFYHRTIENQVPAELAAASYLYLQLVLTCESDVLAAMTWPPPSPPPFSEP